jgi:hypothetical protein
VLSVLTDKGVAVLTVFVLFVGAALLLLFGIVVNMLDSGEASSAEAQLWYEDPSRYEQQEFFNMCYVDMVVIEGWSPDRATDFCNAMWWEHQ